MNDKYNSELLNELRKYNQKRKLAFANLNLFGEIFEENEDFERILKARYNKCSRIKKRMVYLFYRYKYIYFITFTFDDDLIKRTERTKRDYIKAALNQYDFKYILNKDFGKNTEREHYHCVVGTNYEINMYDVLHQKYPCFIWVGAVNKDINNLKRVEKYMNKLTNHALKDTTIRERVVYNFKGFDSLPLTTHEKWIVYRSVYLSLFGAVM